VLKGNWINFFPPKYVIARKVLTDQFVALTTPVRIRQAMVTLEDAHTDNCYSNNLGATGFDFDSSTTPMWRDSAWPATGARWRTATCRSSWVSARTLRASARTSDEWRQRPSELTAPNGGRSSVVR
jgi:hypothetical protein